MSLHLSSWLAPIRLASLFVAGVCLYGTVVWSVSWCVSVLLVARPDLISIYLTYSDHGHSYPWTSAVTMDTHTDTHGECMRTFRVRSESNVSVRYSSYREATAAIELENGVA